MAVIAVYSMKGGVGKSCSAVNLAWNSAVGSSRRTLLWDLDPQGAASFSLRGNQTEKDRARAMIAGNVKPEKLIRPTEINNLDLLAADVSLRGLDRLFFQISKKRHLGKLLRQIGKDYDRIILDCPPGLTETSEQILRNADIVIVPQETCPAAPGLQHGRPAAVDSQTGPGPQSEMAGHPDVERGRTYDKIAAAGRQFCAAQHGCPGLCPDLARH